MRRLIRSSGVAVRTAAGASRALTLEPPLIKHSANLIIDPLPTPAALLHRFGRPKVIATMGPSTSTPDAVDAILRAGVDVARFNMSHGSHADHHRGMQLVRESALRLNEYVGIALDTRGPEVRLGCFAPDEIDGNKDSTQSRQGPGDKTGSNDRLLGTPKQEVETAAGRQSVDSKSPRGGSRTFEHGDRVTVSIDPNEKDRMSKDTLYLDYQDLLMGPSRPTHFLISDGNLELQVEDIDLHRGACRCFVTRAATVFDRSNVHIVGIDVNLPLVSEQDEADLSFGVVNNVDFVFASFVRSAQQVHELRGILGTRGRRVGIVSKIETASALQNLDAIIEASDGLMVARGDLGVALPIERAFFAQKKIIAACNLAGKPVICATQMLESMIHSRRPTRAETTDVANAVIDGADALMLSAESARGDHPDRAVRTLSRISAEAIGYIRHYKRFSDMVTCMNAEDVELNAEPVSSASFRRSSANYRTAAAAATLAEQQSRDVNLVRATLPKTIGYIAEAAVLTSLECQARCIVTATVSGNSVRKLRQCCPKCPIVAVCKTEHVARQLSLVRGVTAMHFPEVEYSDFEGLVDAAIEVLKRRGAELASDAAASYRGATVAPGDLVVVTCTDSNDPTDFTAFLKIRVIQ
jgi:pyruvate kinase